MTSRYREGTNALGFEGGQKKLGIIYKEIRNPGKKQVNFF